MTSKSRFDPTPYQSRKDFTFLEAAFLWLEIEPTEALLEEPPHPVSSMAKTLAEAQAKIYSKKAKEEISIRYKEVVEDQDIVFSSNSIALSSNTKAPLNDFLINYYEATRRFLTLTGSIAGLAEPSLEDVKAFLSSLDKVPSSDSLIKRDALQMVANSLGKAPRFLYSDEKQPEHRVLNSSFYCFVKAYCEQKNINWRERGASKKIEEALRKDFPSNEKDYPKDDTLLKIIKQMKETEAKRLAQKKPKK